MEQREIKFRAWDNILKEMKYPNTQRHPLMTANAYLLKDFSIVMQYTGLKDKNGKEIYEGDIVLSEWYENGEIIEKEYTQIKFANGSWLEGDSYLSDTCDCVEIIGNIYQTPELLKKWT